MTMISNRRAARFDTCYFAAAVLLFFVEVGIALYVKDQFVRPYVGDFLVVVFIYCFLKSFWNASPRHVGVLVLLFALSVEIGQYFRLVDLLGLGHSLFARIIIGTGFDWGDFVAYTLGIALVLALEKKICDLPK